MSRELEKVKGVYIKNQYHSNELDTFSRLMFATFNKPIQHQYYELVNKKGKVVQIIDTNSKAIVQSAATRLGLNYRIVEFEESFEDLDKQKDNNTKEHETND